MRELLVAAAVLAATTPQVANAQRWTVSGTFNDPPNGGSAGKVWISVEDENGLPVKGLRTGSFQVSRYICNLSPSGGCQFHPVTIVAPVSELSDGAYVLNYQEPNSFFSSFGIDLVRVSSVRLVPTGPGKAGVIVTQHAQVLMHR